MNSSVAEKKEIDIVVDILKSIEISDDLAGARQNLDNLGKPLADDMESEIIELDEVRYRFITPPNADPNKVIIYLHGGGYFCGSLQSHGGIASEMARCAKSCALQVEYRKAPEHQFPAPIEDSVAAYRWLLARGFQPKDIAIAGDSAGGGLVVATLLALKDQHLPQPACGVCISPWVDMEATGESHVTKKDVDPIVKMDTVDMVIELYMAGQDIRHPYGSPIHGDLSDIAPLLIQVGEREILQSDSHLLEQAARNFNVPVEIEVWPEMVHVWHMFHQELKEARQALTRCGDFIEQQFSVANAKGAEL